MIRAICFAFVVVWLVACQQQRPPVGSASLSIVMNPSPLTDWKSDNGIRLDVYTRGLSPAELEGVLIDSSARLVDERGDAVRVDSSLKISADNDNLLLISVKPAPGLATGWYTLILSGQLASRATSVEGFKKARGELEMRLHVGSKPIFVGMTVCRADSQNIRLFFSEPVNLVGGSSAVLLSATTDAMSRDCSISKMPGSLDITAACGDIPDVIDLALPGVESQSREPVHALDMPSAGFAKRLTLRQIPTEQNPADCRVWWTWEH